MVQYFIRPSSGGFCYYFKMTFAGILGIKLKVLGMNFLSVKDNDGIVKLATLAANIWKECFAELLQTEQIDYMLDKFQSERAVTDQIKNQDYEYYFIVGESGNIVGYTAIKPEPDYLFMSKLYLINIERGKGYAKGALDFIINRARALSKSIIRLTVNKQNQRAINAYKKAGFTVYGTQCADIGGGWIMDDYLMEYVIN